MSARGRVMKVLALAQHPVYGLDLSEATGLRAGRLYPALARLEAEGMIGSEWEPGVEPRRRLYWVADP